MVFFSCYCTSILCGLFCSDNEDECEEEVDELDFRDEDQYWLTDTNLVVEESVTFASEYHSAFQLQQQRHRNNLMKVAVDRLKGYDRNMATITRSS